MEYLMPVVAAIIWSINPAIIFKFARDAPPLLFASIRTVFGIIIVGVLLIINGIDARGLTLWIMLLAILSGILDTGVGDAAYIRSIQLIGGALAVVIGYTYIFIAQAFSALMYKEEPTLGSVLSGMLAFAGVIVAAPGRKIKINSAEKKGFLLAVLSSTSWGLATSLVKLVEDSIDALSLALIRFISASIFTLTMSVITRERWNITKNFIVAAAIIGALGWGIGMVLFIKSIYVLGVSATVIPTALTPILSQFACKFVGGEKLRLEMVVGALLVALGIVLRAILASMV